MKKLILTCTLVVSACVVSFAQNVQSAQTAPASNRTAAMNPEKAAELRAKRYQQQLGLTDDQYKKVYDAELEYVKADMSFRSSGQPVPPGPAQQMQMAHDQKFQGILTPDQYSKYDKMRTVIRPGAGANAAPPATTNH